VESGDMDSVREYQKQTAVTTMILVRNIVDCQLFVGLVSGLIRMGEGKEGHIGFWTKLPEWILRWYCIGTMRQNDKTSRADKVQLKGTHVVDLTTGDCASITGGRYPKVRLHNVQSDPNGNRAEGSYKYVQFTKADGSGEEVSVMVHHLIVYAFDNLGQLYEWANKWTVWRGYLDKSKKTFSRPTCNLDQDAQDTVGGACKTDVDHALAYLFNCLYALWRCHHAVNQWFHQIRMTEKNWLHCPVDEPYLVSAADRGLPSFKKDLLKTLEERLREKLDQEVERDT